MVGRQVFEINAQAGILAQDARRFSTRNPSHTDSEDTDTGSAEHKPHGAMCTSRYDSVLLGQYPAPCEIGKLHHRVIHYDSGCSLAAAISPGKINKCFRRRGDSPPLINMHVHIVKHKLVSLGTFPAKVSRVLRTAGERRPTQSNKACSSWPWS